MLQHQKLLMVVMLKKMQILKLTLMVFVEIVRGPQKIDRARHSQIQPRPWLPSPAPMQQTHRTRMQRPATVHQIIAAQAVLVPPVVNRLHVAAEYQKKRRKRTQLVNPLLLLNLHPSLDLSREPSGSPSRQVDHHHAGVEIARALSVEHLGELGIFPEFVGEILGEIRVAVLRSSDHSRPG